MSWGWKIVIVYVGFVIMTLSMVFYFMGHKVELVEDDYYKQEIEYQSRIDKINNANQLREPLVMDLQRNEGLLSFKFPKEQVTAGIEGNVVLYRPSNAQEDKELAISVDSEGGQQVSVAGMSKGLWKIKISWSAAGKEYYDEKTITL